MQSNAIKSFLICALGGAVLAGCAAPASSPMASASRANVQSGKVSGVETASAAGMSAPSSTSGASATGTGSSGGPALLTVTFADGTQSRYSIEKPTRSYAGGEPVQVITDPDRITILPMGPAPK